VLHALPHLILPDLIILIILANSTSYEAPHYAAFSNLLSLHPSSAQKFSSAPRSQTPSVYVPPYRPIIQLMIYKFCEHLLVHTVHIIVCETSRLSSDDCYLAGRKVTELK
jgi:hypothetical protein